MNRIAYSQFAIGAAVGVIAVILACVIWWTGTGTMTADSDRLSAKASGLARKIDRSAVEARIGFTEIVGRSSNDKVRELSNKLAKEFERDPSVLAQRLADDDIKYLAYDIGRDLIVMFPDKSDELMEGFKVTRPAELASHLCGKLVESIATRGDADKALDITVCLEPGRNRIFALMGLGNGLPPERFGEILEALKVVGAPGDTRRIESSLINRAPDFEVEDLEKLMALTLKTEASSAVGNAYGSQLVAGKGRAAALEIIRSSPPDRQDRVLHSVLNNGAAQEGGAEWLLESLASLPDDGNLDRGSLTTGVAQRILQQSGSSAMEWVNSIPEESLRETTVRGTMSTWLETNSVDATKWVDTQAPGRVKDAAIVTLVKFLAEAGDVQMAQGWVEKMRDIPAKQELLQELEGLSRESGR